MSLLKISNEYVMNFIDNTEYQKNIELSIKALNTLKNKNGKGNDYIGWVDLPNDITNEELSNINKAAQEIQSHSDYLVVIGIGGSYLGAKAAIEMMISQFKPSSTKILFAGHQISSDYLADLVEFLEDKEFSVNVISKSGTTTEPAIAFRILKKLLLKKYGTNASSRIYVTTDKENGALRKMANQEGFVSFVIPQNVGGRYSVLTPVGLLPMAVAGIDIKKVILGAKEAYGDLMNPNKENTAILYSALRNSLYDSGKQVEILVNYNPKLVYFSEWWKQLFGESEGKEQKGLFISSVSFSTDLHSLGQFIQDGSKVLFETVIHVKKSEKQLLIEQDKDNLDGLNYLAGKSMDYVNDAAFAGTLKAHVSGDVPNIIIDVDEINELTMGYLFYWFEVSCGISGYVLGVNPFNQPGVEFYKKNMFEILGKPGY